MSKISPFKSLLPNSKHVTSIASKPYDVMSHQEAAEEIKKNPFSYLNITRPDAFFSKDQDLYGKPVYEKALELLNHFKEKKWLLSDDQECFYIYQLQWKGKTQTGLVALSSVEDYENGIIKKHELTRTVKENDRINHMLEIKAQTGNVFLIYKDHANIIEYLHTIINKTQPLYHFESSDKVLNTVWAIKEAKDISHIQEMFANKIPQTYIADGHHRAASAYKINATQKLHSDYFLTTLFATHEVSILPYHRVLKNISGFSINDFFNFLKPHFAIQKSTLNDKELEKGQIGFYFDHTYYVIEPLFSTQGWSTLETLDVNVLQQKILEPFFDIQDIRTDSRVDFIGGIRGHQFIQEKVDNNHFDMAFFMSPVLVDELLTVSDNNQIMPPKSTWFEPKLKDGLFTYQL